MITLLATLAMIANVGFFIFLIIGLFRKGRRKYHFKWGGLGFLATMVIVIALNPAESPSDKPAGIVYTQNEPSYPKAETGCLDAIEAPKPPSKAYQTHLAEFKSLYAEFNTFKNKTEFKHVGYMAGYPYGEWLDRVNALGDKARNSEQPWEFEQRTGFTPWELEYLGQEYFCKSCDGQKRKVVEARIQKAINTTTATDTFSIITSSDLYCPDLETYKRFRENMDSSGPSRIDEIARSGNCIDIAHNTRVTGPYACEVVELSKDLTKRYVLMELENGQRYWVTENKVRFSK